MRVTLIAGGGIGYPVTSTRHHPALSWLVAALASRVELTVVSWDEEHPRGWSEIHGARMLNLEAPPRLRVVLEALHRLRPDAVHGIFARPQGQLASAGGYLLGIPSVVSLAGGELSNLPAIDYGMLRSLPGRLRLQWILAMASRVTAGSQDMVARASALGIHASRVPLGVGAECFGESEAKPGPPWRLIHVGHLSEIKGTPTLLRAMARIAARESAVHLDAFGIDLLEGRAQRLAHELGIAVKVTFHGKRPPSEVVAALRLAHLHLLPSLDDASPVSVLEAAALGIPTVGSRVGYLADWGAERSWPVPPGDDEAMAEGVLALLHSPAERKRRGEAARAWARAHDADASAVAFIQLYSAAAAASRSR